MDDGMEIVEVELAKLEAALFEVAPERRAAIERLLDTRNDHLPEPVRRSEASTGFAHNVPARVSCEDCLSNGRAMFGCVTCGGRGYREVKRERDPMAESKVTAYGLDGSRHDATRARDRAIDVLDQQLRPATKVDELADANAHPYAWERARARMYASFDYAALDRALEQLQLARPGASPRSDASLAFLDDRMPDLIRAPAAKEPVENTEAHGRHADTRALSQRDTAIVRAINGGAPTGHVASSFGLSVSQVNKIVGSMAA